MAEIQAIIDAIIVVQKALTVPSGQKDIQQFTDEPPASIGVLPAFLNLVANGKSDNRAHGHPQATHNINMHLLFSTATKKYPRRQAHAWLESVMAGFPIAGTIGGTVFRTLSLEWDFNEDDFPWGESLYDALSFVLEVEVDR